MKKLINTYTYDANGNMLSDLNKDIDTIRYNVLNLPEHIHWKDGSTVDYQYTADGQKVKVDYFVNTVPLVKPVPKVGLIKVAFAFNKVRKYERTLCIQD